MPGKLKVRILAGRDLPIMDRVSDLTDAFVEVSVKWLFCFHIVEKKINLMCKLTQFVILDFFEIFYSEKLILKVSILMTVIVYPTFLIPN